MNTCILKIDTQHAKVYNYPEGMNKPHIIDESHAEHHTHDSKDANKGHRVKFYHAIATYLQNTAQVKEVYILGSKVAGAEFKHHLENHNHKELTKKIIGVDTIDGHATDADVFAKAKEFFKHYRSFTPNY
jgi:hypothetical protein